MAVLAETTAQVLVDDIITLPVAAVKIDEIVASIRDMRCFVIENKVIFQGILHKQIFFVDLKEFVRHMGVDIPFSGFVDLPGVPAGSACTVSGEVEFIQFELLTPETFREMVVIRVSVTVYDTLATTTATITNITNNLMNNVLTPTAVRYGVPGTVRAANGGPIKRT